MSYTFKTLLKKVISGRMREEKDSLAASQQLKLNRMLLLTLGILSVLYLVQVNTLSTKGFAIKDLQKKINQEQKENDDVRMRIIEAQSLGSLEGKIDALGLVRADRIDYLTPSSNTMASLK